MNIVQRNFLRARKVAENGDERRQYRIGAVGIRSDGATVVAPNISNRFPHPVAHAEARLCRKLDVGSTVYVVRILRDGSLGNARPCYSCRRKLASRGVARCYYSINDGEYGVMVLAS